MLNAEEFAVHFLPAAGEHPCLGVGVVHAVIVHGVAVVGNRLEGVVYGAVGLVFGLEERHGISFG